MPRERKPRQPGKPGYNVIENHPDRLRIERDLGAGVPVRVVAQKYGISKDCCQRYRLKMPPQLKTKHYVELLKAEGDLEKLRVTESEGLLANLAQQRARLLMMQDLALELADGLMVARLSNQIHENLSLVGKYLGEFANRSIQTSISLLVTPEYLELRAALVRALKPFPETRKAVAAVLHRVESDAARNTDVSSRATPAPGNGRAPPLIEAQPIEVEANA